MIFGRQWKLVNTEADSFVLLGKLQTRRLRTPRRLPMLMSGHRSGKRPLLAAVLAYICPGLGHVYLREWLRALLWFALMYTTTLLVIPESAVPESGTTFSFDAIVETTMQIANTLPLWASLALFGLLILNTVDAYRLAKRRNQRSEAPRHHRG